MKGEHDIVIPVYMLREIADAEADFCQRVKKCDPMEAVKKIVFGYEYPLTMLERYFGKEKVKTLRILEIGSGNGFFLCYALKCGLDIIGVEPGKTFGFEGRYLRAIKLLNLNSMCDAEKKLIDASAEKLPFKDNSFDVVISIAVLEHVRDLDMSMRESIRVLKPGGFLWANVPNYNSTFEGHHDVFWIPYMTKGIAKKYVKKVFNRDPYFIDELNFTTPKMFKKYLDSKESCGKLYLHGRGWVNAIFWIYSCCVDRNLLPKPTEYRGIKEKVTSLLQVRAARLLLRVPLCICVGFLELLGQAIIFDVFLYKRGTDKLA